MSLHAISKLSAFFGGAKPNWGSSIQRTISSPSFPISRTRFRRRRKLVTSGVHDEDALAAAGEEVVHFAEESMREKGVAGLLMVELSRVIDTEAAYSDRDLALAKQGAAFVAVHCRTEAAKIAVWKCLEPTHPSSAGYYHFGGIEHLARDT